MKVIKAIYNFLVGDMIILIGVLVLVGVLLLIENVSALAVIRPVSGVLMVVAIIAIVTATLAREAYSKER